MSCGNAQALAEGPDCSRGVKLGLRRHGQPPHAGGSDAARELTGKELEHRLDEVYITANKNTVPNEPRSPFVTSGLRLGTPAVTTRGLNTEDMDKIAECIALAVT